MWKGNIEKAYSQFLNQSCDPFQHKGYPLEKSSDPYQEHKQALKEETENELKALEHEVISYMTENELTEEITNNAKITYKPQSRTTLDKAKLTEILGDDLKPYEKVTTYSVLRIK